MITPLRHIRLILVATAACGALLAQSQGPVQSVGTGRATPKFANPFAPSPMHNEVVTQTTTPAEAAKAKLPSFHEFLAAKNGQPQRVDSPEAAEAWVTQYSSSGNEPTVDPVTGQPKFSTTVTLSQTKRPGMSPGASNEFFNSWMSAVHSLMIFTFDLPAKKSSPPAGGTYTIRK